MDYKSIILRMSNLFQITATYLIKVTQKSVVCTLFSLLFSLIILIRCAAYYSVISGELYHPLYLIAFIISLSLLSGILSFNPFIFIIKISKKNLFTINRGHQILS